MKNALASLLAVLALLPAGLAAQDWRLIDPTDSGDRSSSYRSERAPATEPGYGELPVRGREPSRSDSRDYSRADIWSTAGRDSGGAMQLDTEPAKESKVLPPSKRPWSSTYFPFQDCNLAFHVYGPEGLTAMEMYDSYVLSTKGRNPGAAAWEASSAAQTLVVGGQGDFGRPGLVWRWNLGHNMAPWMIDANEGLARVPYRNAEGGRAHQTIQVDWWGHCNGWAAAAVLTPEPPERITVSFDENVRKVQLSSRDKLFPGKDAALGERDYKERRGDKRTLTFTGADLKGLLTEAYLSTAARLSHPNRPDFYRAEDAGIRYDPSRRQSEDQLDQAYNDVLPHNFHRIMLDHMEREKGLVADKDADEHVNNLPIVGWAYQRTYSSGQKSFDVRARVWYADYAPPTYRGTKALAIDYTYRMFVDRSNRVTDSQWLGKSVDNHPDFIWVPDRPIPAPLKRNPKIDLDVLDQILKAGRQG